MEFGISGLLRNISTYSIILPVLALLIKNRSFTGFQRPLIALVLLSLLTELLAYFISKVIGINNLPLLHLYTAVEFFLIVLIYKNLISSFFSSNTFFGIYFLFFSVAIYNAVSHPGILGFNDYARALESILVIFLVVSFFYKTLTELNIISLEKSPSFWLNVGFLIYFSGNLFIFILSDSIRISEKLMLTAWGIHALLNIILNLFIALALWMKSEN